MAAGLALGARLARRPRRERVVVGSKNFTEQVILGELLARALEDRGFAVERRLDLGGTILCHAALRAGQIDVYVEYTGTALTAVLKQPARLRPGSRCCATVRAGLRAARASRDCRRSASTTRSRS